MTSADFQAVLESFTDDQRPPEPQPVIDRVAVLGGGIEGQALAAWFLANGAGGVSLFSVYQDDLARLARGVTVRGAGPIGTYQTQGDGPHIAVTSILEEAVAGADLIVVTGTVLKQRTYGLVLADRLAEDQILLVAPGRTFGALETTWWLRVGGASNRVTVAEMSALPFGLERRDHVLHFHPGVDPMVATLPSSLDAVVTGLQRFFPSIVSAPTVIHSSFADHSGAVEAVALLVGGPVFDESPDLPPGAVALAGASMASRFQPGQVELVERLVDERRRVAERWGVRDLPDPAATIAAVVGDGSEEGGRTIPTAVEARSRLRCAVLGSLVPLASAAEPAGIDVPATRSMIDMAKAVLGGDLDSAGRRLDRIGIRADSMGTVRRTIDSLGIGWS